MKHSLEMPVINTPAKVWTTLALVALGIIGLLWFLLGSLFWGTVGGLAIFAIFPAVYTETVEGFQAKIMLDVLSHKQRVVFQGLNMKVPWETPQKVVDLRVELKEVLKETYPSEDAEMATRYVYTIRPLFTPEGIIRFNTYEPDAIRQAGRALFSMLLSDHYGRHRGEDLRDKDKINKAVFHEGEGLRLVREFEEEHGADVEVRLEDSDFPPEVQKARDIVAKASSFAEAVNVLVKNGTDKATAEKIVRMMNLPNVQEHIISIDAKGLENVRDVSVLGNLGGKK